MATEVESLQISINAKAQNANKQIDALVGRLDVLSKSLGRINGGSRNLNGLANGVDRLGRAMQTMNTVKTADFTRLANNLAKLGNMNVSALNSTASSLSHLTRAFNAFGGVSFDNKNLQNMINSITRLSNSNVQSLASVDFSRLGISINQLATSLSNAPKIQQSVISMTNAIANLSKSGQNIPIVASSLVSLGQSMNAFMASVSSAPNVSENVISFAQAVGLLANSGTKAGITAKNLSSLGVGLRNLMATLSKAPLVSQNVIQMTNALANLSAQGARVGSASRSIERGLNRASKSAERATKSYGGLASAIGKFYATYFLVIRAIRGVGKSITSTADYLEAFNYFNVALGKIGSDWSHQFEQYGYDNAEAYADSFSERLTQSLSGLSGVKIEMSADGSGLLTESGMKNLGLNIQEITQYASQLASVTNSVGQTGEVSLATASAFTKLGADLSSLFNLDYADVMRNLQSGLIGQSRALYKYGIDITNATLQTYAYELGLEKAVSEMTQAEKMQLRMIAILEQSKVSWGDLSNTINSPSNMLRQFKNNLKEVGMILGQLFIPLMQKVMPVVNGVTIAIKRLLTNIAGFMGVKLDLSSFGQGYTQIEDEFGNIEDSVDGATEAVDKFKSHTLGIDELNIASPDTSGADTSGLDNTIDLTEQIIDATEEYEKVWGEAFAQMENKAEAIADVFSEMFKPFENIFENIAVGDWFAAGQGVSDLAVGILNFFKDAIAQVNWSEVGQAIGDFFAGIDWSEVLKSAIELLAEAIKSGVELIFSTASSGDFATTAMATAMGIWGLKKFTGLFGLGKGAAAGTAGGLFGGINLKSIFKLMPNALVAMPGMAGELWRSIENLLDGTIFDTNTWTGKIKEIDDAVMGALENTFAWDETSSLWKSAEADFEAGGLRSILGFAKGVGSGFLLIAEPIKDAILGLYDVYDTARPKLALSVLENIPEESAVSSAIISGGKIASGYIEGFNSTIVTGATNGVNAMLNNIEKILSKSGNITKPLQDSLILTEDKFNKIIKKANELNGTEINIPINVAVEYGAINPIIAGAKSALGIQAYEVGGFPEDGLFFANHNELVGQFSNGKTAVANNGQIVEGIEGGVERAVARVLAPYLADIARNTRETADKDLSVNIGDRDIARANNRGQRSLGYQLIT